MILLASQSSGRLATLRAAGVEPLVRVSDVDEHAVLRVLAPQRQEAKAKPKPGTPQQVQALARAKAADVADTVTRSEREADPDLIVVGCDSMLEIGGRVVGKPETAAIARGARECSTPAAPWCACMTAPRPRACHRRRSASALLRTPR